MSPNPLSQPLFTVNIGFIKSLLFQKPLPRRANSANLSKIAYFCLISSQFLCAFIKSLLNKHMKLTDAQYQINRQTNIQTDATNEWLKNNGIKLKQFTTTKPRILVAQQTAYRLLTEHQSQLSNTQISTLRFYINKYTNSKQRNKITDGECFSVLNIQSKLNRQLFKAFRQSNQ